MPEFYWVVLVLILLAALFVLSPVLMRRSDQTVDRQTMNVAVFEERLHDLQAERNAERLTEAEFLQLKLELERRLLEDAPGGENVAVARLALNKRPVWLMALAIPVIAGLFYLETGAKADWDIANTLQELRHASAAGAVSSSEQFDELTEQLEARLERQPDNAQYLMLLANTSMERENYPSASDAFRRLADLYPEDATVLAQYAQALYLASERQLTDKVQQLASRALSINPQQSTALGLLGIANFERGDFQVAIDYWQQLLPMLGPVSPNRQMIEAGIERARAKLVEAGVLLPEESGPAVAASITVDVSLAEHIQADDNAVVFVYARPVTGSRMPLAVARVKVSELPASIVLDDSMAMAPSLKLSSVERVEVIARISKNGIANRGPGDIEGVYSSVDVAGAQAVSLTIDTLVN